MHELPQLLLMAVPLAHCLAGLYGVSIIWLPPRKISNWPCAVGCGVGLAASGVLLVSLLRSGLDHVGPVQLYDWASVQGVFPVTAAVSLQADVLSVWMLALSNLAATVLVVASSFQRRELESAWTGPLVSLQLFAVNMLLVSSNFVMLLFCWQLAAVAAFLIAMTGDGNAERSDSSHKLLLGWLVADVPLFLGVGLVWLGFRSLEFSAVLTDRELQAKVIAENPALVSAICFCLLAGVVGRCAQFPLWSWLDVVPRRPWLLGALVQTTTIVPVGVYLLLRCVPLLVLAPDAALVMTYVGVLTAVLAGWIAACETDLFRMLGYSTASHIGLALAGLGAGTTFGQAAATYHLSAHALLKAAIFVAVAAQLQGMKGTDRSRLAGGRPAGLGMFLIASLALCSGFLGQNAVMAVVRGDAALVAGSSAVARPLDIVFWACAVAVGLQALALFRAFFWLLASKSTSTDSRQMAGTTSAEDEKRARPGWSITVPASLLLIGGIAMVPWLFSSRPLGTTRLLAIDVGIAGLSLLIVSLAVVGAWLLRGTPRARAPWLQTMVEPAVRLGRNRFHLDDVLALAVVKPIRGLAEMCRFGDALVIGHLADLLSKLPRALTRSASALQDVAWQFNVLALLLATTSLLTLLLWFAG